MNKLNFVLQIIYMKSNFIIVPLAAAYAKKIRESGIDDFGNTVYEQVAKGKGPCRVSLRPFEKGKDTRLLFKHNPFAIDNAFSQPGPVFIHKNEVEAYSDVHRFPPEIKADPVNFPLTLIGYNKAQHMVFTRLVVNDDVDELIISIFNDHSKVHFLHARNAEAGCYICRIDRVEESNLVTTGIL
jgi:hypothetical protein